MILDDKYRLFSGVSNSGIKDFIKHGPKIYYDKYVDPLRVAPAEQSTESTDIGDLTDCLSTQKERFDEFYYIMSGVPSPAIKWIMERARELAIKDYTSDPMDCSIPFNEVILKPEVIDATKAKTFLIKAASEYFNPITEKTGYHSNWKEGTIFDLLIEKGKNYYTDLAEAKGRRIIDHEFNNTAERIVNKDFKSHDIIGPILFTEEDELGEGIIVEKQFMVTAMIEGVMCKILLDYVKFDLINKFIYPKDVKTSMSHRQFMINYIEFNYGNQGSFYTKVLQAIYPEYMIMPFEFIVGCSESKEPPYIYRMSHNELKLQMQGAITKSGREHRGWLSVLKEIKWHTDNDKWLYPKEVYEKGYRVIDTYSTDAIESLGLPLSNEDYL